MQRLILIGEIDLLKDFNTIFSRDGKYLISRTYGRDCFFEMSGESMYYALVEEERKKNISLREYKQKIVYAIQDRLSYGQGRLIHKSFSGGKDTQFRSTNSAIRTLLIARSDGFNVDNALKQIVEYHFSYYFKWLDGIWFCHDSSELDGETPLSHIRTRRLGKDWRNTLTLNTHVDSINTLILLKKSEFHCDENIDGMLNGALLSINQLLNIKAGNFSRFLQRIDSVFLDKYVNNIWKKNKWTSTIYERIVHPVVFKLLFPTFFFENGIIARDLSVLNRHLDYLLVNIVDLSRMLCLYNDIRERREGLLDYDKLLDKLKKGVDWIESHPNFVEFVYRDPLLSAWYAEMYYTLSNIEPSFTMQAQKLVQTGLFCSYSPFYKCQF